MGMIGLTRRNSVYSTGPEAKRARIEQMGQKAPERP